MKFTKLSLATCVAVAGLSSVSLAQPLEEAIKGVEVNGFLRYRYNDTRIDNEGFVKDGKRTDNQGNPVADSKGSAGHNWRAEATFKTPVVNNVAMTLGIGYHNVDQNVNHGKGVSAVNANGATVNTPFLGTGLGAGKDSNFGVTEFYATISPDTTATTIQAGKMRLATPLNDSLDDRGTGILAMNSDLPNWTFVAGAFDSWSTDDQFAGYAGDYTSVVKPLYTIAALANYETGIGNINAEAWLFSADDLIDSAVFAQLGWDSSLAHLKGQYILANLNNDLDKPFVALHGGKVQDSADLYIIEGGVKFHDYQVPLAVKVGYWGNSKDSYSVSLDNGDGGYLSYAGELWFDNPATGINISVLPTYTGITMPLENESNELSIFYGNVSYDILDNLTVGIDYVKGTNTLTRGIDAARYSGDIDFQEITPKITWQYSKALKISTYYAMLQTDADKQVILGSPDVSTWNDAVNTDSEDKNRFRVEVRYNF
ncbi:major outer membrane protein [Helicobacter ibis]|uniref:Major outer membrane protein n=1 Tax=Helicobacter ibis TaxID=2962633 RepID=A0ABT4VFE1_9HELI|nr:major outer membrane protein [Helicobacter ibis]MDA3968741.1 major outer membrane protein [Helicobacter ibis]